MLPIRFPTNYVTKLLIISFDVNINMQQAILCDYWAIFSKLPVKIVAKNPVEFYKKKVHKGSPEYLVQ